MSLGDFDSGAVIYGKFTTFNPSTGAPFTLGGTPALSVYKDNSTTQTTTGVTLTADFDSVTGLNHFAIDTSDSFYAVGSFFDVVITTGTVNAVSAVGRVVGRFTIRKTACLKPTTAGRTLDVSSGGEAGIDLANVGSPTQTLNLSGTTISTSQVVASVSGAVGSVTGNVGGNVVGSVDSVTDPVTVGTNNDKTGYSLATTPPTSGAIADAVWNEAYNQHTTAGTFGKLMDILRKANYVSDGSVASGGTPTTTVFRTDLTEPTGTFDNQTLLFVSGALTGQSTPIETYSVTNGTITVGDPLTAAPTAGDAFVILPDHVHPLGEIADAVLDDAVEGSETLRQAVRLIRAAAVGKLSGAATTEITIRDAADTKARITATVDSNGNRSAVTTDAT
jgi:hypothetical protein